MFTYSILTLSTVSLLVKYYANEYLTQDKAETFKNLKSVPEIKTYDFIIGK